nr:cytochrome c [Gemmatimonadaceae bacterium]
YQINCVPCHGDAGMGDGPVTKYGMPGIALISDVTKARSDGYIFGMIRNGRGLMPPYNRIEEMDRWDVVNYLRGLQGVLGRKVAVGPLAAPGVTGKMLPGATRLGPTRPVPYYHSPMAGPIPVAHDSAAAALPAASSTTDHVPAPADTAPRDSTSGRVR